GQFSSVTFDAYAVHACPIPPEARSRGVAEGTRPAPPGTPTRRGAIGAAPTMPGSCRHQWIRENPHNGYRPYLRHDPPNRYSRNSGKIPKRWSAIPRYRWKCHARLPESVRVGNLVNREGLREFVNSI